MNLCAREGFGFLDETLQNFLKAFFEYLEHKRPELVPEYERLYRGKYAPRATQQRIQQVVAALKGRMGFAGPPRRAAPPRPPLTRAEFTRPTQLRLL